MNFFWTWMHLCLTGQFPLDICRRQVIQMQVMESVDKRNKKSMRGNQFVSKVMPFFARVSKVTLFYTYNCIER